MSAERIRLAHVGDLILAAPDIDRYLAPVRAVLADADLAIGHVEWPHTGRGYVSSIDIPAPAAPPECLDAVARAGIRVATLAANHIFDQGAPGVADTIARLNGAGVATTGAGTTLDEARRPAVIDVGGVRVGVLSYNAVGPRESWASDVKAGAAYVRILSHYELEVASPGSPPTEYTAIDAESLDAMHSDIAALKADVDVVSVSLHKGMVFVRSQLAQYERPLARAAIDAGADMVVGHHAHILRGVEIYKGKPVFHGINHFVTAYPPDSYPKSGSRPARSRPRRSPVFTSVQPDERVHNFPYSAEARNTMVATVDLDQRGVRRAGFVPCYIDQDCRPIPVQGEDGATVTRYVADISREAGLSVRIEWDGQSATFYEREDCES